MQLPGRLAKTTLGDLLGRLYRYGATGALELSLVGPPAQRHRVHLQRGLVVGVELDLASPPHRLGEVLVREGLSSEGDVARALEKQRLLGGASPRHGDLLVRAGALSPEARDRGLRKQTRARLDLLFAWIDGEGATRDGEVRFLVGPAAAPRAPKMPVPLSPREYLHGRRRARVTKRDASPRPTALPRAALTFDRLRAMRLLGVGTDADPATIRRAFRSAAAKIHPDRHASAPPSERARLQVELAELSAAYHLLCA